MGQSLRGRDIVDEMRGSRGVALTLLSWPAIVYTPSFLGLWISSIVSAQLDADVSYGQKNNKDAGTQLL